MTDKSEVLANFFSSVFTEEDVKNLPKMNIRNNTHNEVEIITQKEVKRLLVDLNTAKSRALIERTRKYYLN